MPIDEKLDKVLTGLDGVLGLMNSLAPLIVKLSETIPAIPGIPPVHIPTPTPEPVPTPVVPTPQPPRRAPVVIGTSGKAPVLRGIPPYRPEQTFEPMGTHPDPGHPWRMLHVPYDAEAGTGEWIQDTFDDAFIFYAVITWVWQLFSGPGQQANLVVYDYWGRQFRLWGVQRTREPKHQREIDEGSGMGEEEVSYVDRGWNIVAIGDSVAYHPDIGKWSAPIESAQMSP